MEKITMLEQDLLFNSMNQEIPFDSYQNKTILVTGATGLIGSNLIRTLLYANHQRNLNMHVTGLVRNEEKARRIMGDLMNDSALTILKKDLLEVSAEDVEASGRPDYIFHTAAVTTSKLLVQQPVEAIEGAVLGTGRILRLAADCGCSSVVYLSSMEMYGTASVELVKENDLGYINPLNVRSNYPESKRMCENMCAAYASEYHVPVKIARLSQTFGPGILPGENRVFAQFARSVMNGQDIVMHTKGLSEGNYCYLREAIAALMILLVKGKDGEAYNIVNESTHTTIAAMAEMLCNEFGNGKSKVVFDIPESNVFGYAADAKIRLSGEKMRNLGWTPVIGLKEMYSRMMQSMQEEKEA